MYDNKMSTRIIYESFHFSFLAFVIISLALLIATIAGPKNRALIIICIIIAIASCGLAWASFGVNHLDIGAHFAGILMGISNCMGSVPGFLVPVLTGYVVENTNVCLTFPLEFNIFSLLFYFLVET